MSENKAEPRSSNNAPGTSNTLHIIEDSCKIEQW